VLVILLTSGAGTLVVLQDSRSLAILGSVGGFLAPVLVSTDSDNHVALFSYYLVLNAAILGIAWYRAWRGLNLIGFAFTFGVGTLWGIESYRSELIGSTEPFLILYFLFYQAIAILYAFRQPPNLRGLVDGTIIFGTPLIVFALQAQLVEITEYGLAISAAAMAAFYGAVATWLRRSYPSQMRLLSDPFIALGVAFATIAIPLALDDRWTSAAWALEGVALVWVGVRQQVTRSKLSGSVLLIASGVAFLRYGWIPDIGMPVLNGNLLGGLMASVASPVGARVLIADSQKREWQPFVSTVLMIWGLGWWFAIGTREILDRAIGETQIQLQTVFIALSAALLAWVARRYEWTAARLATLAYLPALAVLGILDLFEQAHFLDGIGVIVCGAAIASHFYILRAYDPQPNIEAAWHFAGVLFIAGVIAEEVYWRIDQVVVNDVWASTGALLVPALASLLVPVIRDRLEWPIKRYWSAYLAGAGALISLQLFLVGIVGFNDPGNPAPLAYMPIFNPLDFVTFLGLAIGLYCLLTFRSTTQWLTPDSFRIATLVWASSAFVLTTIGVVRGVHHLAGVEWEYPTLADSVSVQSALSIYWGLLAFSGMILGARKTNRGIGLGGASLMGLVVIKLFLVDLGNSGTVARIVSFLGVGVLLLVVGYFAPAPPRKTTVE